MVIAMHEISGQSERLIDNEARRLVEFMDILSDVSRVDLIVPDIDMTDEYPVEFAKRRFLAYSYEQEPTLFLNPSLVGPQLKEDTSLAFEPLVARAGKRSAHGVFFGRLHIGEQSIDVAVKPHMANAFTSGPDDYFKTAAMQDEGFYSLTPAALLLTGKDQDIAYSMSVLEEGLTTLDSIDWQDYFPDMTANPGMQDLWREVSGQAAVLHAMGNTSHGDLAARNIAIHPDGAAFFIDWEYAYIASGEPRDAEARYNRSYGDLSTLLESMCLPPHANIGGVEGIGGKSGIGIFYGKNEDWWQGFCDIFWDEYVLIRLELAKEGNHKGKVLLEVQEELEQLEISLKSDMEMMQAICASIPPVQNQQLTQN